VRHGEVGSNPIIDEVYLPFSAGELAPHFAPVKALGEPDRHLAYYLASAKAAAEFRFEPAAGSPAEVRRARVRGRQMEKDERFWVAAALMSLFHADGKDPLVRLLSGCLGEVPPFEGVSRWDEALGAEPVLYFEVSLPSPPSYRRHLAQQLDERVIVPYLREAARRRGTRLEGATKVDALLLAPDTGFAVLFEAKVLSDISGGVEFDVLRNQIARNIDVMLDPNPQLMPPLDQRNPDRSCFVLLTPEVFRSNRQSRLYGWLYDGYREDPQSLQRQLPHRQGVDFTSVVRRLGWTTWEDCNDALPGACSWLAGSPRRPV
jgi:hypothetical protein